MLVKAEQEGENNLWCTLRLHERVCMCERVVSTFRRVKIHIDKKAKLWVERVISCR